LLERPDTRIMSTLFDRLELLMLTRVHGLGSKGITSILRGALQSRCQLAHIFKMDEQELRSSYGLKAEAAQQISQNRDSLEAGAKLLDMSLKERGVQVLTFADSLYPKGILQFFAEPPPILFAYGNLGATEEISAAVLTSADPTPWAMQTTACVANAVAQSGAVIVTGHNRPSYQEAALAGKRAGTPIVVPLDRGILNAFRGDLTRELLAAARIYGYTFPAERDLVVSPFRPEDHWVGHNNRIRDALVVAMARIVVAVEVREGGVMHRLCLRARQCGKRVLVCKPGAPWPEASGNTALIASGFEAADAGLLPQSAALAVAECQRPPSS